jgi:hypothetical protein
VVEVARAPEDADATARLLAAVPHAELDWRLEAGARFALILDGYAEKIPAIKWLREVTGLGLGEAKIASESLPYTVLDLEPWETARDERVKGPPEAVMHTRLVTVQGPPRDSDKRYGFTVQCLIHARYRSSDAEVERYHTEARTALERLIDAAPCLSLEPRERNGYTLIARELTRSELRRVMLLL